MRFFPVIVWFVIIAVGILRSRNAQRKAQEGGGGNGQQPSREPHVPVPATARSRRAADPQAERRALERRRLIEEKKQAMARRKAADQAFGSRVVVEESRRAPTPSAAAVEEEGCHVTPMGAPHVSDLRNAKAPAIAHMEAHIGEAHGADVDPDAAGAMRRLNQKPTFVFARTAASFRHAVVLAEILDRPRAYRL